MPTLYSYCISTDTGAAPNPFWNICTLNICKPGIRRNAKVGDWVVATGTVQSGFTNKVIYAMEVTRKLTMEEYDTFCKKELLQKIPNSSSKVYKERVGDCIYDFSTVPASIIGNIHNEGNRQTDLNGNFTLLSDHFYYFGDKPEQLPDHLLPIVLQGQGHKSISNQPHFHDFVDWILTQVKAKNLVYSLPIHRHLIKKGNDCLSVCAYQDKEQGELDNEHIEE